MNDLSGRTILIVDDEPELRKVLENFFRLSGCKVLTAENGTDALDLVLHDTIDAVVSDIKMPGGDGIFLLEGVRRHDPRIPVVVLISGFTDVTREDAISKGATALIPKPFNFRQLVDLVARSLQPIQA